MNAYIASFMLLVANAIGFALPASAAVTEEQIASNANSNETQNAVAHDSDVEQIDNQIYMPVQNLVPQLIAAEKQGDAASVWTYLTDRWTLADNQHVEGAP